jgi:outer membrane protein TolC
MIAELQRAYANWRAATEIVTAARALARQISRTHEDLVAKQSEGIADRLSVARAALQVAEVELQLAVWASQLRHACRTLESVARTPLHDPVFARFLAEINAGAVALPES